MIASRGEILAICSNRLFSSGVGCTSGSRGAEGSFLAAASALSHLNDASQSRCLTRNVRRSIPRVSLKSQTETIKAVGKANAATIDVTALAISRVKVYRSKTAPPRVVRDQAALSAGPIQRQRKNFRNTNTPIRTSIGNIKPIGRVNLFPGLPTNHRAEEDPIPSNRKRLPYPYQESSATPAQLQSTLLG